jgi:hypothetical protein
VFFEMADVFVSYALAGDADAARSHAAECMAMRPQFSIRHYLAKTPFKRPADAMVLAEGMRKAGLPE